MSDAIVEEVRARADLVEICGEHMSLRRVGKTFRGPCPLHGGDGPNFSIDPSRGIFKCFVCGEGGDVFSFIMKHLGHDFPSSIRHLAERVGVQIPDEDEDREDPHAGIRQAAAFAEEWFAGRLLDEPEGAGARDYLRSRGIGREEAERYALGFAPDGWRGLRSAAHAVGIEDDLLLEAGLLATSDRAREPYDRFRNRLIFSIRDLRDRPLGFGGRDLGSEGDVPKYINSPESPIFTKGRTLYALNWARHAMRKEERAIVVEGYTDALALHLRGMAAAVAPLGTALTAEQARTLGRYAKKIFLVYDSDDAGLRATFRSADALLAAGLHPLVVTLPRGEDPDSLVRKEGADRMRKALGDAVDALERKLQILERQGYLDSIEGRRRAVDGVLSSLRAVSDPALRDLYIDRAADRIGIRRETLVREVARARGHRRRPGAGHGPAGGQGGARSRPGRETGGARGRVRETPERTLCLLLLRDESLVERASRAGLEPGHFREDRYRKLYRELLARGGAGDEAAGGRMAGAGDGREEAPAAEAGRPFAEETRAVAGELLDDPIELTHPDEIFESSARHLLHRSDLERLRQIQRELAMAEEKQGLALLEEKQNLRRSLEAAGVHVSFLRRYTGS